MDERQFYIEKQETKTIPLTCPACRKEDNYPIRWIVRTKKNELPRGAGEEDKKRFALARSYMVRVDELVACRKCRKRFELTGQSVVLVSSNVAAPGSADFDPRILGQVGQALACRVYSGFRQKSKPDKLKPILLTESKSPDTSRKTLRSIASMFPRSAPCFLRSSASSRVTCGRPSA